MHRRILVLPVAALIALSACSTSSNEKVSEPASASAGTAGESQSASTTPATDEVGDEIVEAMPQGTFTGTTESGAKLTLHVPAETPADIEAFRVKTGAAPVGYVLLEVDNSASTEQVGASGVTLVDSEGNQLEYESAFIPLDDWGPTMRDDGPKDKNDGYWYSMPDGTEVSEDEYRELSDEEAALYNANLGQPVAPRAKGSELFIGPAVPEELLYVEVQDAMMPIALEPEK